MEKQYIISESVLTGLLGYLQTRPYKEVAQGISLLMQLPPFETPHEGEEAAATETVEPLD